MGPRSHVSDTTCSCTGSWSLSCRSWQTSEVYPIFLSRDQELLFAEHFHEVQALLRLPCLQRSILLPSSSIPLVPVPDFTFSMPPPRREAKGLETVRSSAACFVCLRVCRGWLVRARLPLSNRDPCLLKSTSKMSTRFEDTLQVQKRCAADWFSLAPGGVSGVRRQASRRVCCLTHFDTGWASKFRHCLGQTSTRARLAGRRAGCRIGQTC